MNEKQKDGADSPPPLAPLSSLYPEPQHGVPSTPTPPLPIPGAKPSGHQLSWKNYLHLVWPLLTLVLVSAAGWFWFNAITGLKPKTIKNGDYTYIFKFDKGKPLRMGRASAFAASDNSRLIIIKPTSDLNLTDCAQIGAAWSKAFDATVVGKEHPVCTPDKKNFYTNFTQHKERHQVTITFQVPQQLANLQETKEIIESIEATTSSREQVNTRE